MQVCKELDYKMSDKKLCSICEESEACIDTDMCEECNRIDQELKDEMLADRDRLYKGVMSLD